MTVIELTDFFNKEYGIEREWPKVKEVDHQTFANVCKFIFDYESKAVDPVFRLSNGSRAYTVFLGQYGGIMFKNVELLLRK